MDSTSIKTICILPFVHMKIGPTSKVQPCCLYDYDSNIGDLNEGSISAIWNGAELKKIRTDFLHGRIPEGCKACISGVHSYREKTNDLLSRFSGAVENTKNDGEMDIGYLVSLDLRLSNLCNLRCRMCNHENSSALFGNDLNLKIRQSDEQVIHVSQDMDDFSRQLENILPNLYRINLSGGEPLIIKEQYEILDSLAKNNQRDIKISYSTNLTKLTYQNYDVVERWKKFSDVSIYASLDAMKERAAYIRHGSDWNGINENIRKIKANFRDVKNRLNVSSTLSAYNAYDIMNLHKYLIEKYLFDDLELEFYFLNSPAQLDIRVLPQAIKIDIEKKYTCFVEYLIEKKYTNLARTYQSAIKYLQSADKSNLFRNFKIFTKRLDKARNESFDLVFPEFMRYKEFSDIMENISWQEPPQCFLNNKTNPLAIKYEVLKERMLHVKILDKDWKWIFGKSEKINNNAGTAVFDFFFQDIIPGDYILVAELRDEGESFATNTDEIFEPISVLK
jgi:MoaA/NifB/PqqE/SkfB family radical SAM enzyme